MREFMSTSGRHGLANEVADAVSKITRAKEERYIVRSARSAENVLHPPIPCVLASSPALSVLASSPALSVLASSPALSVLASSPALSVLASSRTITICCVGFESGPAALCIKFITKRGC